jgi:hypothetical protein
MYDIAKRLYWKQANYLIVLWSELVRQNESAKTFACADASLQRGDLPHHIDNLTQRPRVKREGKEDLCSKI